MNALYGVVATSSGGREGHVPSSGGVLDLPLSMPRELGGSGKPGQRRGAGPGGVAGPTRAGGSSS